MTLRSLFACAWSVALLLASRAGRADSTPIPPLHLRYAVEGRDASARCPDEEAFRRLVALRLGVDPFVAPGVSAERTLVVEVEAASPRRVTVTLLDAGDRTLGRRVIREPPRACDELVANAAFAASVAIDPTVLSREPASVAPPSPEPAIPPATPQAPAPRREEAPPPAPPPPTPFVASIRAGAGASLGVLPKASFGPALGAFVRRGRLSAGAEARFDLPSTIERDVGDPAGAPASIDSSLFLGVLSACGHLRARGISPYLCATFRAGALRASASGIARPKDDVAAYLAAGPRFGVALPITGDLAFDVRADVPFALTSVELRVDDRAVYTAPPIAAVLGAGLVFSFP